MSAALRSDGTRGVRPKSGAKMPVGTSTVRGNK
jgi:hypothetical protein